MTFTPRLPTDTVAIVGTFNKKWLIQFQNRRKHHREFLCDVFSIFTPVSFETLDEAFETAEYYKLKVVDVRIHHAYQQHDQINDTMQEKIKQIRAEFDGTYVKKIA